jgi:hypothetical protein
VDSTGGHLRDRATDRLQLTPSAIKTYLDSFHAKKIVGLIERRRGDWRSAIEKARLSYENTPLNCTRTLLRGEPLRSVWASVTRYCCCLIDRLPVRWFDPRYPSRQKQHQCSSRRWSVRHYFRSRRTLQTLGRVPYRTIHSSGQRRPMGAVSEVDDFYLPHRPYFLTFPAS